MAKKADRGRPRKMSPQPLGLVEISDPSLVAEVEFSDPMAVKKTLALVATLTDDLMMWHFEPYSLCLWSDTKPVFVRFEPSNCYRYCSLQTFTVCVHPQNLVRALKQVDAGKSRLRIAVPKEAVRQPVDDFTDSEDSAAIVMQLLVNDSTIDLQIPLSLVPPKSPVVQQAAELMVFEMDQLVLRKLASKLAAITLQVTGGKITVLSQDPKLGTMQTTLPSHHTSDLNCKFTASALWALLQARDAEKIGIRICSKWVEIVQTLAHNTLFLQIPALIAGSPIHQELQTQVTSADGGCQGCIALAREVSDSGHTQS